MNRFGFMQLPLELLDHIISFLSSDSHRSLFACSLVASSWTDPARRCLFYELEYAREEWAEPDFPSLLRFLRTTYSVAKHVRILDLRGQQGFSQIWGRLDSQTFAGLLAALPGLEDVILNKIILLPSPSPIIDPPEPPIPVVVPKPLRYLDIRETGIKETDLSSTLSTLCEFLRPISSVRYLQFYEMHSSGDLESVKNVRAACKTLDLPTNFKVETLEFTTDSHLVLLPMELIRRAASPSLRNLDYSYFDENRGEKPEENKAEILQLFLGDVGAELEDVTVDSMGIQEHPPNLSECTSLRILEIGHTFMYNKEDRGPEWLPSSFDTTLEVLNSAPRIPFKLYLRFEDFCSPRSAKCLHILSKLEWENLERALVGHPCRVNRITFICQGLEHFCGFKSIKRLIRERLPGLNSKGLLSFERHIESNQTAPLTL